MDQTKKIPDPDSFAKNVESTIDELFSASRHIEIDPLTSKVRELSQDKTDQGQSFQVVGEEKETKDVNLEQQFSQLHQLLLTLEWEVTQTHVVSAKNLVKTIQKNPAMEPDKNLNELLDLMAMILEGMADHPEKMPTFGPEALQKGLDILKNLVWNEEQDPKAKEELLKSAKKELESAIDMKIPEVAHKISEEADIQEKAAVIESELPEHSVLVDTVKFHIKILDDCIGYILPVEKLLARTPGMEKLHHFQENIKGRLEEQKKILEKALTGDYEPSVDVRDYTAQRAEDITIEIDKKDETPSVSISCPWHELVIGQWDQKQVAFVPEDVAFARTAPWWAKKRVNKLKTFKLKKLKAWPWTKIQPLMQGELSNQKESQLTKIEFPVLQKSNSSIGYSQPSKNPTVLVLSRADKGLVLMLDTPLETISITPEYSWEPSAKINGPWVGNLKIENKQISVATLESLLNTLTNA